MKTSVNGLHFIASWEGEVLHAYKDIAGIETIGIGHVIRPGESFPDGITHDEAMTLLAKDVGAAEYAINSAVRVNLSQNEFDALVSFTFNLGAGALEASALLHLLNAGDYQNAAAEFPKWCHAKIGGVMRADPGLLRRRMAERALFVRPDDAPAVDPKASDAAPVTEQAVAAIVSPALLASEAADLAAPTGATEEDVEESQS